MLPVGTAVGDVVDAALCVAADIGCVQTVGVPVGGTVEPNVEVAVADGVDARPAVDTIWHCRMRSCWSDI